MADFRWQYLAPMPQLQLRQNALIDVLLNFFLKFALIYLTVSTDCHETIYPKRNPRFRSN
jgi:hypothetical protein